MSFPATNRNTASRDGLAVTATAERARAKFQTLQGQLKDVRRAKARFATAAAITFPALDDEHTEPAQVASTTKPNNEDSAKPNNEDSPARRSACLGLCFPCEPEDNSLPIEEAPLHVHFTCGICLDVKWKGPGDSMSFECCDQPYCASCWAGIARTAMDETEAEAGFQRRYTLRCPTPGCKLAHHGQIERNITISKLSQGPDVAAADKTDLKAFVSLVRAGNSACRCPTCKSVCYRNSFAIDNPNSSMVCSSARCRASFCFVHGLLHEGLTCEEYLARTPMDPSRRAFARRNHTRACPRCGNGIMKAGGCNHMRCACGHSFTWTRAKVEVPCSCLNLTNTNKKIVPWGAPPCAGASPVAYAKLGAYRCIFACVAVPVALSVAVIASPVLMPIGAYKLHKHVLRPTWQEIGRRRGARNEGLRLGTFEYTFRVHGNGRNTRAYRG